MFDHKICNIIYRKCHRGRIQPLGYKLRFHIRNNHGEVLELSLNKN